MIEPPFTHERYTVLEPLGSGGMATVYKARDKQTGAVRAIKVLDESLAHRSEVLKRFELEAATMDRLSHPHIVPLHDVCLDGEYRFIVMDFIDGESLVDRMERKRLTPEEALEVMIPVLDAIQTAHDNGVVHRDIKPHNILISRAGHVFISDFGIARCIDETDMSLTRTGMVMGTWAYMAPEQRADAKGVDLLADIYSLGATLYAAVTSKTPKDLFAADLDHTIYRAVPNSIEAVIRKACAYWTSDRYTTAAAMKEDLELTLQKMKRGEDAGPGFAETRPRISPSHDQAALRPLPAPEPTPRREEHFRSPERKNTTGLRVAVVAALIVLVGLFGWMFSRTYDEVNTEAEMVEVEVPAPVRKGRIGADDMASVEAIKPALSHSVPEVLNVGEDLKIEVDIPGSKSYDRVIAWYRPRTGGDWLQTRLRKVGDGYAGRVSITRFYLDGFQYWIEAKPYTDNLPRLTSGSESAPHNVDVRLN